MRKAHFETYEIAQKVIECEKHVKDNAISREFCNFAGRNG
jgi:hypothetical protein